MLQNATICDNIRAKPLSMPELPSLWSAGRWLARQTAETLYLPPPALEGFVESLGKLLPPTRTYAWE